MKHRYAILILGAYLAFETSGCSYNAPSLNNPSTDTTAKPQAYMLRVSVSVSDYSGNSAIASGQFNLPMIQDYNLWDGKPVGSPYYSAWGYRYGVIVSNGLKEKTYYDTAFYTGTQADHWYEYQSRIDSLTVGAAYTVKAFVKAPNDSVVHYSALLTFTQPGDPPGFKRLKDFPEPKLSGKTAFIIGGNLYFSGIYLYEYIPKTDSWRILSSDGNLSDPDNLFAVAGGKVFAFTTYANMESFDPVSESWSSHWDDSLMGRTGIFFFSDGKSVYGGGGSRVFGGSGYPMDNWKYSPSSRIWKKMKPFPGKAQLWIHSVFLNGKAYLIGYTDVPYGSQPEYEFWEYDPVADSWLKKTMPSLYVSIYDVNWTAGSDRFYLLNGKDIWSYIPASDSWHKEASANIFNSSGAFAWISGIFYVGLHIDYSTGSTNYFWQYTP